VYFEDYAPEIFNAPSVVANDRTKNPKGWADPDKKFLTPAELKARLTYCGTINLDIEGYPLNPQGRTGLRGRGLLGKWGPNHAADPIVTRLNPTTKKLEMVAVQRADTKEWAIPGGMVDPGERVSATLKREFCEEALGHDEMTEAQRKSIKEQAEKLFASEGDEVYRGYVDDPRNTDNAWMETVAVHFHCPDSLGQSLALQAGSDASAVRWLCVEDNETELKRLYASHADFVRTAVRRFRNPAEKTSSSTCPTTSARSSVPRSVCQPCSTSPLCRGSAVALIVAVAAVAYYYCAQNNRQ
jgi:ADP-ribose pyrophosphatase